MRIEHVAPNGIRIVGPKADVAVHDMAKLERIRTLHKERKQGRKTLERVHLLPAEAAKLLRERLADIEIELRRIS